MSLILSNFHELKDVLVALESTLPVIESTGALIVKSLHGGKTVYACGNGGSATDSMHLCEELVGRYRDDRLALPAVSLNTDTSVLTCIANDYGFESIFSRQVEALGKEGDVLVGFSTSGSSENIYRAFESARSKKLITILLTGNQNGKIEGIADYTICIPSGNTARIQELHTFVLHGWLEMVETEDWT